MLPEHLRTESPSRALHKGAIHQDSHAQANTYLSSSDSSGMGSGGDHGKVGEQLRVAREREANAKKELEEERVKVKMAIERETQIMKEMQRREHAHDQQVAALMIRIRGGDNSNLTTSPVCMCLYMHVCAHACMHAGWCVYFEDTRRKSCKLDIVDVYVLVYVCMC